MLKQIIDNIKSDFVYIQTHNFPDPDAIGSAFGMQYLLKLNGISSKICYKGQIDSNNTTEMIDELGIELFQMNEVSEMSENDEIILVDSQKGNANIIDMIGNEVICIDHHPIYDDVVYRVKDIRPQLGACSSIVASYFFDNNIEMPRNVATALSYGIKVDTANLVRGVSDFDLEIFCKLRRIADNDLLLALDQNTLKYSDLRAYAEAISNVEVYGFTSFANPGPDCPDALIATISDFLLALAEVKFSVVYSQRENGIKVSIRSELPTHNAGAIANKALAGIGSGGGHAQMAGGFVPFKGCDEEANNLMGKIKECFIEEISKV